MKKISNRIAHIITQSGPYGGAQRNTLLTLRGLLRDGYEAELVCGPGGRLIDEARAVGAQVHVLPDLLREVNPIKDARALLQLYRLCRARQYRITHTHSTKAGFLGRLAARWAGVPAVVHTVHGVPFEIRNDFKSKVYIGLEKLVAPFTRSLVCVGEELRQELLGWNLTDPKKLVTIYSGIDFSAYVPQREALEIKRELGLDGCYPILGSVGRLCEQKAQYYLVEAVAGLRNKFPQLRLLLVGDGELRPRLTERIRELGLSSHVLLLGERDDIAELLHTFDIYVMSSNWEGVGRALTEAMFSGLPIVATAVNGVTELVVHEQTGLLVPPHEPRALAAAIDRMASEPELARNLGSSARRKAQALMDAEKMVKDIEDLYTRLTWPGLSGALEDSPKGMIQEQR